MIEKNQIHPIGIGTFNIELEESKKSLEALQYSVSLGQNLIDTSLIYDNLDFIGRFLSTVDRDNIFVSTKISKTIETLEDLEKQLDKNLSMMGLDYVDAVSLHTPFVTKFPLEETYAYLETLVKKGKARYLGISNATLQDIETIQKQTSLFSFEGLFNLECKNYEDSGVTEYCKNHDIMYLGYQALRRNRTAKQNYPLLVELAEKYGKSQNQIILNWIIQEKGLNTILKSTNMNNIKDNNEALLFHMEAEDVARLNAFRSSEFDAIAVDFKNQGGVSIDQLPNQL